MTERWHTLAVRVDDRGSMRKRLIVAVEFDGLSTGDGAAEELLFGDWGSEVASPFRFGDWGSPSASSIELTNW